jgi:3-deoxy-D-manno-octulosonic-acid transferase
MYFSPKLLVLRNAYNILTHLADYHLRLIGLFNKKLMLGVRGRSETFKILKKHIKIEDKVIWFHCASLGEYEQGLPVFEEIRQTYPSHKILLSFFSPSGYEIRKNSPIADAVVYLPLDTKINARAFLNLAHPELIVFVKYEIWPNYLSEVRQRGIKSILISALFRKEQSLFKPRGIWIKRALRTFDHIFVQNGSSEELLKAHGFNRVTLSGDTRFDRVSKQLEADNSLPIIEAFKGTNLCFVAGSTWPEGEALLTSFINCDASDTKYIIAPHNIKVKKINALLSNLKVDAVFHSKANIKTVASKKVLIIDSIGLLSRIYAYADMAYVGGAIGNTGLHNTLEAAVFGVPIVIGNNYSKFPEAVAMIQEGGMFSINNYIEFEEILQELISNTKKRRESGLRNADYIKKNRGAVIQILNYLRI